MTWADLIIQIMKMSHSQRNSQVLILIKNELYSGEEANLLINKNLLPQIDNGDPYLDLNTDKALDQFFDNLASRLPLLSRAGVCMFTVLSKADNTTYPIQDNMLLTELKKIFPDESKNFYEAIKARIITLRYWKNFQFSIIHDTYDPSKVSAIVKTNVSHIKNVPHNRSTVKIDRNFNQWILFNTENGKSCVFFNLAEVARCMNIDYQWLYQGICKHTVFQIDKYSFTRNSTTEKIHTNDLLAEVL